MSILGINGLTPGDGRCVATGCGVSIRQGRLMCRRHWRRVPSSLRCEMKQEWRMWRDGLSSLGDLRYVQVKCVKAASPALRSDALYEPWGRLDGDAEGER